MHPDAFCNADCGADAISPCLSMEQPATPSFEQSDQSRFDRGITPGEQALATSPFKKNNNQDGETVDSWDGPGNYPSKYKR